MIEVVAFAFVVSLAFVLFGKMAPHRRAGRHHPRSWNRIDAASRVHCMRRGRRG